MNLHLSLLLLLSTANALTWNSAKKTRAISPDSISTDESAIIVTLPATTSTGATIDVNEADVDATRFPSSTGATDGAENANVDTGMSVEEVSGYYANTVADYYGSGVSVTVDKVESSSSSYGSVSGSGVSKMKSSVSVVKGGGSKSKGTFWSVHASKKSVTGKCLYTKGSSSYKNSIEGSSSYFYKGSSKKSRSSQGTCVCKEKRRELQWGNDGHSSSGGGGGTANKVSGGSSANKVSGNSNANKVTSGSSKVTTVKVSGTSSKMTGGMWAGDAHGASSKVTSNKSTSSKVTGTASKVASSGGMWAGDAYGISKMTTQKTSKITSVKGSSVSFKSALSSEDSKSTKTVVSASWKGDSWGPSKVTTVKESSVSVKGSSSYDYYCSCETSFEIDVCGSPTPSPINPLAPQPSIPVDTNAPSVVENIEVDEILCVDDFAMTTTGVSVEIPVLDNDGFIPSGISGSITQPNNGLTIITDSSILYIPYSNICGVDTFTYTINDASGQAMCTASVTVSIICTGDANTPSPTVTPTDEIIPNGGDLNITENITDSPSAVPINPDGGDLNIAKPVANDDYYTTNQDESIEIAILKNDTLIVGTTGTYTMPPNGQLSTIEDDLLYTPDTGFCGSDMFSYTLTDATGEYSDSAVVTIDVICAELPSPMPTYFTGDDLIGVPPDFTLNSSAPSPQPTLYDGDDAIGVNQNFNATQPPIDRPDLEDDYAITNQSVPVFIPILDNDVIPSDSTGSMGVAMHGEVDASVDGIIYTPEDYFCGFEKFEYSVTDSTGKFTDSAQVTIEVICVDSPTPSPTLFTGDDLVGVPPEFGEDTAAPSPSPTLFTGDDMIGVPPDFNNTEPDIDRPELNDDYATTNQGEPVIIPILANDTIPTDSTGSFTNPEHGVVTILTGDDVLYTPDQEFCGTDSFTYTIKDTSNNADTATVTVDVACKENDDQTSVDSTTTASDNHVPVAKDDEAITPQNQPVFINVAANDEDKDDDALIVTSVAQCKEGGNLVIIGDGTGGVVEYTPASGFYGTDHCDYTICDEHGACDAACIVVTVEKSSAPPLAVNDAVKTEVDVAIEIEVTENDISPNGSPLTVVSVGETEKGAVVAIVGDGTSGFVFYEPPVSFVGNDEFNYTIVDEEGQTSTAMVYITVNSEKDVGVITSAIPTSISSETTTPSFAHGCSTAQDSSVIYVIDKDPCAIITSVTGGANGVCEVTGKGTITYTPDDGFTGTDECEYELCKDSSCSSGVLTITVIADGSASEPSSTEAATTTSTAAETTSASADETTSSIPADTTTATIMAETTTTETPVIVHDSGNVTESPSAYYMCPEVDPSNVTQNTLLYKYEVVLVEGADLNAAIEVIELEMNDLLASQMRCSMSGSGRSLLIAGLVGADSNPADTLSDEECESGNAGCVVVNGGLTVYGDADIEEVQSYLGSVMPDIVSSVNATVIEERLSASSAMLESSDATAEGKSSNVSTVAIAGAAVVAVLGAAMFLRKRQSHEELSDESEAVLRDEFPQKTVEIPNGSSNEDSDTLLTSSTSFESKSKKSLKSVFRNNRDDGRLASPVFSISSSKSKSYNIEDTVDL
ncbi:hypothetical protein ACHAXN_004124 [Cyclotella atomus]